MRRLLLMVALTAALTLAFAVGAPVGMGAPNPCPGPYEPTPTDANPEYIAADTNLNGTVCVSGTAGTPSAAARPLRVDEVANPRELHDGIEVAARFGARHPHDRRL